MDDKKVNPIEIAIKLTSDSELEVFISQVSRNESFYLMEKVLGLLAVLIKL